ncbi:MAG: YbaB/EbfC family nucleoid-associated protein [Candidatus Omnitrophica bacterium]|nr:YbaB/EbfC family nucleoid-associated protein [Candidatus Omnitrophota bacterium]
MFDKMKALMDMKNKMERIKDELEKTVFDITSPDGLIKITMNGAQDVQGICIQKEIGELSKNALEKAIKDAYNKAVKHSRDIAARKMKDITGFNLPGVG